DGDQWCPRSDQRGRLEKARHRLNQPEKSASRGMAQSGAQKLARAKTSIERVAITNLLLAASYFEKNPCGESHSTMSKPGSSAGFRLWSSIHASEPRRFTMVWSGRPKSARRLQSIYLPQQATSPDSSPFNTPGASGLISRFALRCVRVRRRVSI